MIELSKTPLIRAFNEDCMPALEKMSENKFDLAIVDPPYGIKVNMNAGKKKGERNRYENKKWDNSIPNKDYFENLKNCSNNQIIWGCNYFGEFIYHPGRISWFKNNGANNDFSDCELAMSTFNTRTTNISIQWSGFIKPKSEGNGKRIHPTQKPVALYKWLLKNYAKPGDTILDSHGGSFSIAIACYDMGFDLTIYEKDKDYFDDAVKRFQNHIKQPDIFKQHNIDTYGKQMDI